MEQWRDVLGYEGLYKVSDLGRVMRSFHGRKLVNRVRRLATDKDGYLRVDLSRGGAKKLRGVHHLVAEAFLCARPDGLEINHKDGDKTNNKVDNLEWVTSSANQLHRSRVLGRNNPGKFYRVTSPDGVEQIVRNLSAFCREHGLHVQSMSNIATGARRTAQHHGGWRCEIAA